MSDTFSTFPTGKLSALAMLYVEQQATPEHTPEELLDLYNEAYERIRNHSRKGNPPNYSF